MQYYYVIDLVTGKYVFMSESKEECIEFAASYKHETMGTD